MIPQSHGGLSSSSSIPSTSHHFSFLPSDGIDSFSHHSFTRSFHEPSRPSSASSTISYGGNPCIQPGIPFQSPSVPSKSSRATTLLSPRQPISMVGKHYRSPSSVSKLPSTLARVKLKKELKEAVNRRKESLEACEIEANQRQYVVHKMLVTGLLPEPREDELPKVIPCLLPVELVEGARITPSSFTRYEMPPPEPRSTMETKREAIVSTEGAELWREEEKWRRGTEHRSHSDEPRRISWMKSEGTQTEAQLRESPIRLRRYDDERDSREREREVRHEREMNNDEERRRKTDNLIDATRRYFEEYDRQLREMGSRVRSSTARKHLNLSNDDDALSRETRRIQILDELDRKRRERYRLYGDDIYNGRRGHYGSVPRMRHLSPRSIGDYTHREGESFRGYNSSYPYQYGSLPRNIERGFGREGRGGGGPHIQVDYEEAFGSRPNPLPTSRSLYDLYGDDSMVYDDITRTSNIPSHSLRRSLGYLDQMGIDSDRLLLSTPYESTGQSTDMISQYANYLSRQFGDSTIGRSSFDPSSTLPIGRSSFDPTLPPVNISTSSIPLQREVYDPSLSQQYYSSSSIPPVNPSNPIYSQYTPYSTLPPQSIPSSLPPSMAPISDPYSSSHVYSRSESNYGARPSYHSLDYGNLHRELAPPQTWTTGESMERSSAPYPSTYAVPPSHYTYVPPSLGHGYSQPLIESSYLGPSSLGATNPNRSWSNGNLNGEEDMLSRVYQSAGRRRAQGNTF